MTWQQEFADSITDPVELADILQLSSDWLEGAERQRLNSAYACRAVCRTYAAWEPR